ncbi:unnamed protein product [Cylindrotheca closterium]|uniref:Uncharacterized protein n=1 Tax=Cylindrotheca closterium TaxID=2856 RepID=A0AAD2CED8_9STRA|nr:unnamed protein product [Cylindrotheca closterium]
MTEPSSSSTTSTMTSCVDTELWSKMTVRHLARHGVGNDKKISYKQTDKVDIHGHYLEFPNLTVVHFVAAATNTNSSKLANLPLRLQQTVGVYLSPLPSYHATLLCGPLHIDLNSLPQKQPQNSNLFAECLQEPCWKQMADYLALKQYAPVHLTVGEVVCKESGGVTVYLEGNGSDEEEEARTIRQELRKMGVCRDKLKESLQALLSTHDQLGKKAARTAMRLLTGSLMEPKDRAWHITIAYPRKSGGPMPEEIQEQVRDLVRDAFGCNHDESSSSMLSLEPAQLCLSTDTKTFVPCWNGLCPITSSTTKTPVGHNGYS